MVRHKAEWHFPTLRQWFFFASFGFTVETMIMGSICKVAILPQHSLFAVKWAGYRLSSSIFMPLCKALLFFSCSLYFQLLLISILFTRQNAFNRQALAGIGWHWLAFCHQKNVLQRWTKKTLSTRQHLSTWELFICTYCFRVRSVIAVCGPVCEGLKEVRNKSHIICSHCNIKTAFNQPSFGRTCDNFDGKR